MSPRTTLPTRTAILAALLLTLGLLTGMPAPAGAAPTDPTPDQIAPTDAGGYQIIRDQGAYLTQFAARTKVLHVDTEHATADGFWFAVAGQIFAGRRAMRWVYQPYGLKCGEADAYLTYNEWLNTYSCVSDNSKTAPELEAEQTSKDCVAASGSPWQVGVRLDGYTICQDNLVWAAFVAPTLAPGRTADCAPWEDRSLDPSGQARCVFQSYDYINNPEPRTWRPAPDACVGISADANHLTTSYNSGLANRNVPDCLGDDNAANCTTATAWHPACGGVNVTGATITTGPYAGTTGPEEPPAQTFQSTQTATGVVAITATATRTAGATERATRGTARSVLKGRIGRKKIRVVGTAPVYHQGTGSETRSATASNTVTITAEGLCTSKISQADADQCATSRAQAAQQAQAQGMVGGITQDNANRQAAADADSAARTAASTAARTGPVTAAEQADAQRRAAADARAKLRKLKRAR